MVPVKATLMHDRDSALQLSPVPFPQIVYTLLHALHADLEEDGEHRLIKREHLLIDSNVLPTALCICCSMAILSKFSLYLKTLAASGLRQARCRSGG